MVFQRIRLFLPCFGGAEELQWTTNTGSSSWQRGGISLVCPRGTCLNVLVQSMTPDATTMRVMKAIEPQSVQQD